MLCCSSCVVLTMIGFELSLMVLASSKFASLSFGAAKAAFENLKMTGADLGMPSTKSS